MRDQFELSIGPARYLLCRVSSPRAVTGQVVSRSHAVRLVSQALRGANPGAVRNAYGQLNRVCVSPSVSLDDIRIWFTHQLGGDSALMPRPQLVLVRVDTLGARSGETAAQPSARRRAALEILRDIAAQPQRDFAYHGRSYRLASAQDQARLPNRELFEVADATTAYEVLAALSQEGLQPWGDLLRDAAPLVVRSELGEPEELVLLQRFRSFVLAQDAAPPVTPSALRKARETDWIEIILVDDEGSVLGGLGYALELPNGDESRGAFDAEAPMHRANLAPGSCKLSIPMLRASRA